MFILSAADDLADTLVAEENFQLPPEDADNSADLIDAERFRQLSTGNTTDPFKPVKPAKVVAGPNAAASMSQQVSAPISYFPCGQGLFTGALIGGIGATAIGAYLWQKTKPY